MNILFLGDVVGSVGRQIVHQHCRELQAKYKIDLTIINGENAAHGKGITGRIVRFLRESGADVITLGNHSFSKGDFLMEIRDYPEVLRPMNLLPLEPGYSTVIKEVCGLKVCVLSLCTEVFMDRISGSPFDCMEKVLNTIPADLYFVDLHGEATSEKITFAYYFQDCLAAVVGTHTHVQTADERLLDGCAFITDAGMCGPYESVLGRDKDEVIDRIVHKLPTRYTIASTEGMLCGVVIQVDEETRRAVSIERIQIRP